jgi:hypothetical protein
LEIIAYYSLKLSEKEKESNTTIPPPTRDISMPLLLKFIPQTFDGKKVETKRHTNNACTTFIMMPKYFAYGPSQYVFVSRSFVDVLNFKRTAILIDRLSL